MPPGPGRRAGSGFGASAERNGLGEGRCRDPGVDELDALGPEDGLPVGGRRLAEGGDGDGATGSAERRGR
ncbi:hypothetical protein, partial [Streptomyces sanglieri]|uniref:hypothetical protein n=1 Tax=Streptomyces sanglieri TaxID=193460 RepID=UPI00352345D4